MCIPRPLRPGPLPSSSVNGQLLEELPPPPLPVSPAAVPAHDPPLTSPTPSRACPDTGPHSPYPCTSSSSSFLSLPLKAISFPFFFLFSSSASYSCSSRPTHPPPPPQQCASPIQDKQSASSSGDTLGPFNKAIYHAVCLRLLWPSRALLLPLLPLLCLSISMCVRL